MNPFRYDYAVIGGDLRLACLAEELATRAKVCHYALCQPVSQRVPADYAKAFSSLEAAIGNAGSIIGPIPMSRDGAYISGAKKNCSVKQILSLLKPNQRFYAGCIPKAFCNEALKNGVLVFDLMTDSSLSYFNTIATAEGVICEAIQESPLNLHQGRCAVLGYGKCGRTIAEKLKGMSCHVSVVTDSSEEFSQAIPMACDVLDFKTLPSRIEEYDFIFNTVPATVLTRKVLSNANPSVTILDIASAPGGVDFAAAKELMITAKACPGLPGKYAPLSSAKAIHESIQKFERS